MLMILKDFIPMEECDYVYDADVSDAKVKEQ